MKMNFYPQMEEFLTVLKVVVEVGMLNTDLIHPLCDLCGNKMSQTEATGQVGVEADWKTKDSEPRDVIHEPI